MSWVTSGEQFIDRQPTTVTQASTADRVQARDLIVTPLQPSGELGNVGQSWMARLRVLLAGVLGTVAGIAPHVLHHIGPLAGAAVVSGATGTVVFGVIGLVLMAPSLFRLRRRFNTWVAPAIALAVFGMLFTVSSVWIGPVIQQATAGTVGISAEPATAPVQHDAHPHATP